MLMRSPLNRRDKQSHPCTNKGLSRAHIGVFHGIATGLRHGHDPAIVQDLLAHGLLRPTAEGYELPEAIAEQLADRVERTAAEINTEADRDQPPLSFRAKDPLCSSSKFSLL
jgi:hypothetical protein